MARRLHERIAQPNLYVKIPGTKEGLPAIRTMISEKRSINVTLLFGLERYAGVIETYLAGLEAASGDLSEVSSVASFFVSRVDAEVDKRLDAIGTDAALAMLGKAAVATPSSYESSSISSAATWGPRRAGARARGAVGKTNPPRKRRPDTLLRPAHRPTREHIPRTLEGVRRTSLAARRRRRRRAPHLLRPGEVASTVRFTTPVGRGVAAFAKSFYEPIATGNRSRHLL